MSGEIKIGGLRLTPDTKVVSVRVLDDAELGRVAEVRFLVDDELVEAGELPKRIES